MAQTAFQLLNIIVSWHKQPIKY